MQKKSESESLYANRACGLDAGQSVESVNWDPSNVRVSIESSSEESFSNQGFGQPLRHKNFSQNVAQNKGSPKKNYVGHDNVFSLSNKMGSMSLGAKICPDHYSPQAQRAVQYVNYQGVHRPFSKRGMTRGRYFDQRLYGEQRFKKQQVYQVTPEMSVVNLTKSSKFLGPPVLQQDFLQPQYAVPLYPNEPFFPDQYQNSGYDGVQYYLPRQPYQPQMCFSTKQQQFNIGGPFYPARPVEYLQTQRSFRDGAFDFQIQQQQPIQFAQMQPVFPLNYSGVQYQQQFPPVQQQQFLSVQQQSFPSDQQQHQYFPNFGNANVCEVTQFYNPTGSQLEMMPAYSDPYPIYPANGVFMSRISGSQFHQGYS